MGGKMSIASYNEEMVMQTVSIIAFKLQITLKKEQEHLQAAYQLIDQLLTIIKEGVRAKIPAPTYWVITGDGVLAIYLLERPYYLINTDAAKQDAASKKLNWIKSEIRCGYRKAIPGLKVEIFDNSEDIPFSDSLFAVKDITGNTYYYKHEYLSADISRMWDIEQLQNFTNRTNSSEKNLNNVYKTRKALLENYVRDEKYSIYYGKAEKYYLQCCLQLGMTDEEIQAAMIQFSQSAGREYNANVRKRRNAQNEIPTNEMFLSSLGLEKESAMALGFSSCDPVSKTERKAQANRTYYVSHYAPTKHLEIQERGTRIFELLCQGKRRSEICDILGITIRMYRHAWDMFKAENPDAIANLNYEHSSHSSECQ